MKLFFGLVLFLFSSTCFAGFFIENVGQVVNQNNEKSSVQYYANLKGNLNVHINQSGFSYEFKRINSKLRNDLHNTPEVVDFERVDVHFKNSNSSVNTVPGNFKYKQNYFYNGVFLTSDVYGKIVIENIYNQIDVEFIIDALGDFKYNFILHKGANINDIEIEYNGIQQPQLKNEEILLTTQLGVISESIPLSYIVTDGTTENINVQYAQKSINSFTFNTEVDIDVFDQLVIDPLPNRLFGTYAGGSLQEEVHDICLDELGDSYIVGHTQSSNNIATSGVYQGSFNSVFDVFIMKHDKNGNKVWGTYYGGTSYDRGYGIDYANGNLYIGGSTYSLNMATAGAHQETIVDGDEAFIAKFDTTGNIIWSTYYAGDLHDFIGDLMVDDNENVFVTGHTYSTINIATTGAHKEFFSGTSACFLVKFDSNGNRLWGTYYGDDSEEGWGLAHDSNNDVFLTGFTSSTNGIASPSGVHQSTYAGGVDAFIAKFNTNGVWQWGTYYGGTGSDQAYAVTIDNNDSIYVIGNTTSSNDIYFGNGFQSTPGSIDDGFIAKFGNDGIIDWASYIGGNEAEYLKDVDFYPSGGVVLTGMTQSNVNISTQGSYLENHSGAYDAFIMHVSENGDLNWGTYYGGVDTDEGRAVSVYPNNFHITLTGTTMSMSDIASVGAQQETYGGGNSDAFIAQFCMPIIPELVLNGSTDLCPEDSLEIDVIGDFDDYSWYDNSTSDSILLTNVGSANFSVYLNTVDTNNCQAVSDTIYINSYTDNSIIFNGLDASYCHEQDTLTVSTNYLYDAYMWSTGGTNDSILVLNPELGTTYYSLIAEDENGCSYEDSVDIEVFPTPEPEVQVNGSANFCLGETVELTVDETYGTYLWHDGSSDPNFILDEESWVWVVVTNSFGCSDTADSIFVDSDFLEPEIIISSQAPYCIPDTLLTSTTFTYDQYLWSSGGVDSLDTLILSNLGVGTHEVYVEVFNSCGSSANSDTVIIEVFEFTNSQIQLMAAQPLCVGETFELNIDESFVEYTWSNNDTGSNITDIASQPGDTLFTVNLIDFNGCESTNSIVVHVDSCFLKNDMFKNESAIIYPNPLNDGVLHYIMPKIPNQVLLFDHQGKFIAELESIKTNGSWDLKSLSVGLYHVRIYYENSIFNRKVTVIE